MTKRASLQDVLAMAMTYLQEALCADAFGAALCPVECWVEQEADGALLQLHAGEQLPQSLETPALWAGKPTPHIMCVAVCAREAGSQLLRLNELLELAQIHIIIGIQTCSMHAQRVKLIFDPCIKAASSACRSTVRSSMTGICAVLLLPVGCACCLQRLCSRCTQLLQCLHGPVGAK